MTPQTHPHPNHPTDRHASGFARSGGHPSPVGVIPSAGSASEDFRRPTHPAVAVSQSAETATAGAMSAAPRPAGLAPSAATRTRYPALAGCPDLANHEQLVEAIGYHDLALRLSKRQRWTRVERAAIVAAVANVQSEARTSHQRALEIWAEIQTARGLDALNMAQDAAALAGEAVAA